MRSGVVVVAIMGLLAIGATLLLKEAAERSAGETRDLARWDDDGGNPAGHVLSDEPYSA